MNKGQGTKTQNRPLSLGKLLVCTDTTTNFLGTLNPLRYRGYVYDTETALYYLQSRYYNPEWGRFINADALVSTGQGFIGNNMFTYCLNIPTTMVDDNGEDAIYVVKYKWSDGGLPGVGHSLLYIEHNKNWYVTEFTGPISNPKEARVYVYYADSNIVSKMKNDEKIKRTDYVYIQGDFSESLELALSHQNTNYGGYDVLTNNCLHYTRDVLSVGTFSENYIGSKVRNSQHIIPKRFYKMLSLYNAIMRAINKVGAER